MSVKLYHRKPRDFRGHVLYPLNQLRAVEPEAYALQARKYEGREALMRQRVPILNCLWNDVLHFSPVHPESVAGICRAEGLEWWPADWFELDAAEMGFDAGNSVIFMCADDGDGPEIPASDFEPYSHERVARLGGIPQRAIDHVREVKRAARPHFIFMGIPHVQHTRPLDTRRMALIRA